MKHRSTHACFSSPWPCLCRRACSRAFCCIGRVAHQPDRLSGHQQQSQRCWCAYARPKHTHRCGVGAGSGAAGRGGVVYPQLHQCGVGRHRLFAFHRCNEHRARCPYSQPQRVEFFRNLFARVEALPGVETMGGISNLPLSNSEDLREFEVDGYPNKKGQLVESRWVTPQYFSAMEIPLVAGVYLRRKTNPINLFQSSMRALRRSILPIATPSAGTSAERMTTLNGASSLE